MDLNYSYTLKDNAWHRASQDSNDSLPGFESWFQVYELVTLTPFYFSFLIFEKKIIVDPNSEHNCKNKNIKIYIKHL